MRTRTLDHLVAVADGPAVARAAARATLREPASPPDWIDIAIPLVAANPGEVVFAAAELWSEPTVDAAGTTCLGWIGGLAEVERDGTVHLGVARAALGNAASEPIVLRQVRLHAREGWTPLDLVERMETEAAATDRAPGEPGAAPRARAQANRRFLESGPPGIAHVPVGHATLANRRMGGGLGTHALLVSHGYCADENTFPTSHFVGNTWWYLRANANLTHDTFALDLAAEGERFKSYGIVGHSQDGLAAVHLSAFYWSGLDWAGPGRLIQTLGSPFEGTPLAGNIAALGQIFGIQCGANAK
ncbi:MAG: hypothetical protein RI967_443 [Planctomycetota bacterium]